MEDIVVLDFETTSVEPVDARIVSYCFIKIPNADFSVPAIKKTGLIDPKVPIPAAATAVHGITNEMVVGKPRFSQIMKGLLEFLNGCWFAGYNVGYDLRVLANECIRAGNPVPLDIDSRMVIDPYIVFARKVPHNLSSAVNYYLGEELAEAHTAEADSVAVLRLIQAQQAKYPELADISAFAQFCSSPREGFVDREGKLRWYEGEAILSFGKNKGIPLRTIDQGYIKWLLTTDVRKDLQHILHEALEGRFPQQKK
jgi:DNA polymerase III subunit epsilon